MFYKGQFHCYQEIRLQRAETKARRQSESPANYPVTDDEGMGSGGRHGCSEIRVQIAFEKTADRI